MAVINDVQWYSKHVLSHLHHNLTPFVDFVFVRTPHTSSSSNPSLSFLPLFDHFIETSLVAMILPSLIGYLVMFASPFSHATAGDGSELRMLLSLRSSRVASLPGVCWAPEETIVVVLEREWALLGLEKPPVCPLVEA